jgi:pimeloyl-ACP methyl ester carboxylesterase
MEILKSHITQNIGSHPRLEKLNPDRIQMPMEDFSQFCAEGVVVQDRMIRVAHGISLRVITFIPPTDEGKPAVVFVAGWITQIVAWKTVLREMTKDFIVIYVETREKSSSRIESNADQSISAIGEDIVALVDKLHLRENRYVLFGSSLGATVIVECFHALARKPLMLVLISPNAVFRVPYIWKFIVRSFYPPLYAFIRPSVKWYLKNFRLNVKIDTAQYNKYCAALDAADPWKLKKAVLSIASYDIWNRLESLNCPVLLIGASKDVLHEPDIFQRIASKILHATIIDLETNEKTHSEKVVEEFRSFLSQQDSTLF